MKRIIALAVASALTLACFTGCSIHIKLKDKDKNTTSSYDYDYDYDYDDYSSTFSGFDDTSSSYGEKMTLNDADIKVSTKEAPLAIGDWCKATCYTLGDPKYGDVVVSPLELIRGDQAKQILIAAGYDSAELEKTLTDGESKIGEKQEFVVLKYKVYCPDSFPIGSTLGFNYTNIYISPSYETSKYKVTCFTTDVSNYDIDDYKADYITNGEAGVGLCAFAVAQSTSEILIKVGYDPDYSNDIDEGQAYFLVK